jgi:Domain of unknown function (DUF397)
VALPGPAPAGASAIERHTEYDVNHRPSDPDGRRSTGLTSIEAPLLNGVTWRKATASNPSGDCVEVAALAGGEVAVRHSREPDGTALIYTPAEIAAFLAGAKAGEFDDLAS